MSHFERNLAIMQQRDPELAARMRGDIDCRHVEVMPSTQPGVLTARVRRPSGETVLLHNMQDPVGSARRSAERQPMAAQNASILLGFGLGYLALELTKKLEKKHPLLVCELDPAVLRTALEHVDLAPVLESDYVRILVGPEIPLQDWIMKLAAKFMTAKVDVISYGPSVSLDPEGYARLSEVAQKESRAIILNRNTILKAGRRMMENILQNFPEVIRSAGIKQLQNRFAGRPAVLVSAGPSLEKNVALLPELKDRAVVIAVDTALRLLLPLGIKPDLVATIDFNQANFDKFKNVPIDPDIALVYHPGGYYESISAFQGPKFTLSNVPNRIPAWLMQYVEDKGSLRAGTTVAHYAFEIARYLGCDPIVFIGQDLAFPDNRIHASDLSLWNLDPQDAEPVEDIFGETVGTMTSFKHAIYHFEKAFKETRATVIDATEGGAKKQGATVMRLREVIDEYGRVEPVDIKGILWEANRAVETVRVEELLRDMAYVSGELRLIQKDCRTIVSLAGRLQKKLDAGQTEDDEFVKLSVRAERLTGGMDQRGRVLHLIGEHNFGLELYMMQHAVSSIDEIEDIDRKIARQVERAQVFYPSLAGAARVFQGPLDRLIHRLSQAQALSASPLDPGAPAADWYRRALAYDAIGYRQDALAAGREALARDPDHAAAAKLLARLYLEGNRADEALAVLGRLRRTSRDAARLVAEATRKQAAWADRCTRLQVEFARKVRDDSPETAGWFYYRVKEYGRAVALLEQAVSRNPQAETYARLGRAWRRRGDREAAVAVWEQGLALDPGRADLYKELGLLALEQGLAEQGERLLGEACRLEPDDAEACERLARVYCARGAFLEAGLCYENLLRLCPERIDWVPQIAALYQRQIALAATTQ